jgi:hypothetical protein
MAQATPGLESRSIPDFTADHQAIYIVAGGNDWITRFQAIGLAVCVGLMFGMAAASRSPRFQAARYGCYLSRTCPS